MYRENLTGYGPFTLEGLLAEANARYPIGTVYSSFGKECVVKGVLKMNEHISDPMITDGWGGCVYSFGEWASTWCNISEMSEEQKKFWFN